MNIAKQILETLKTIVDNNSDVNAKYNECLAVLEDSKGSIIRNDRVVNYTFSDGSILTEFNEEDYGSSVTWSINDYEDFVSIEFNDYDYDYDYDDDVWDDDSDYEYKSSDRPVLWR